MIASNSTSTATALCWVSARWSSAGGHLLAHDHNGAVSAPHDGVRITAHQRPPYPAVAATAHDDQPHSQLLGQAHDLVGHTSHPEMGPGNGTSANLYPP